MKWQSALLAVMLLFSGCDFLILTGLPRDRDAGKSVIVENPNHPAPENTMLTLRNVPGGRILIMNEDDPPNKQYAAIDQDYWMSTTEMTQGLWEKVMWAGTEADTWPDGVPSDSKGKGAENPAYYVSWESALVFCNKLTELDGNLGAGELAYYKVAALTLPYDTVGDDAFIDWSKKGYRLPTEAEWEYAARYSYSDSEWTSAQAMAGSPEEGLNFQTNVLYAWYDWNLSGSRNPSLASPAALRSPNELGLYDMSGNVAEWCWDQDGAKRALRGGSYTDNPSQCATGSRSLERSDNSSEKIGFRIVRGQEANRGY